MKIIYLVSKTMLPFILGGMVGALAIVKTQFWWWVIALAIVGLPYFIGQIYVYLRYRKFVNEWVNVMDDFPSKKCWENEKSAIRKESKYGFLFE